MKYTSLWSTFFLFITESKFDCISWGMIHVPVPKTLSPRPSDTFFKGMIDKK